MFRMGALPADEGIVASVVNPAQIWHLAHLAVARAALSASPRCDTSGEAAALCALRSHLQQVAEQAWQDYVRLVALTPAEREGYLALGEPTHITLNQAEGAPVAQWNANNPSLAGVFGELAVPGEGGAFSHHISDMFRLIDLEALPAARRLMPLADSRHASVAAVYEITNLLERDVDRIIRGVEPADAWRAMLTHARFLKEAASETLSYLPEDHYRGWNTKLTAPTGLQQVAMLVDQHAGTNTAQQRLALFYVAKCFSDLMSRADREHPGNAGRRCLLVREQITRDLLLIRQVLDGLNATAAFSLGFQPDSVHSVVFFRAIGHSKPVYVAIPKENLQPPAAITAA
jgi:hypothetical protein